jgi:hypothetical protein
MMGKLIDKSRVNVVKGPKQALRNNPSTISSFAPLLTCFVPWSHPDSPQLT